MADEEKAEVEPLPEAHIEGLRVDGLWSEDVAERLQEVLGEPEVDGDVPAPFTNEGYSHTVETLQLRLGVGLNDGRFGPQTFDALRRRYGTDTEKDTLKALQRRLNEGRI